MIYTTLSGRLAWSMRKNLPDLRALALQRYPDFVLRDVQDIGEIIPVFVFHSVEPEVFEECCLALVTGGYHTLGADEFLGVVRGRYTPRRHSVLLTIDDGGGSTWTVAYPLLQKHGLRAIAFVVSGLVADDETYRPSLMDVWSGEAALDEVLSRERSPVPVCTWLELARMQSSDVVDVQSHTHTHALVHVGPRIRDFLNPATDPYLIGNFNIPVVREGTRDRGDRPVRLGRPVYESLPRMAGRRRYFDDEEMRRECEAYVDDRGGAAFFGRRGWRAELNRVARRRTQRGEYESAEALERAIAADLDSSRSIIEARIGNRIDHVCFPWYEGSRIAVDVSRQLGYQAAYWGILASPNAACTGCDPHFVPRIDGRYVARLPGPRRKSLGQVLRTHFGPGLGRSALRE